VTGCASKAKAGAKTCCSESEVSHASPVICPYCNGLAELLSFHVLECPGNRHLMLEGRRALSTKIAVAHAARR
jgi:hypothetical protein